MGYLNAREPAFCARNNDSLITIVKAQRETLIVFQRPKNRGLTNFPQPVNQQKHLAKLQYPPIIGSIKIVYIYQSMQGWFLLYTLR